MFYPDFISWLPWIMLAVFVVAVVGFSVWDFLDGRLSPEEKTACDLGFEHGYQGSTPVEFHTSSVKTAYLISYQAGEKQRQLSADRKKLDELTGK